MANTGTRLSGSIINVLVSKIFIVCLQRISRPLDDERRQCASSHGALDLGRALFPLFALALDLPEIFFEDKVGPPCI